MAKVEAIYRCIAKGVPMQKIWSARAVPGKGLVGDRYFLGKGAFSGLVSFDVPGVDVRDMTLISLEAIEAAAKLSSAAGEKPFSAADTRRNIVTSGVDLNALVGREFLVGSVRMRGVELANPCRRINKLAEKKRAEEVFAGSGGLRAQILTQGVVFTDALIAQVL